MSYRLSTSAYLCTDSLCVDLDAPRDKRGIHISTNALSHVEVFYYPALSFWSFPEWIASTALWTLICWSAILIGFKKFEEWTNPD